MSESQTILETYRRLEDDGGQAVLATVVDVKGSSYRAPGAKMLIDETGRSVGAISGGCLEADVLERAKRVLKTNEASLIIYDTTSSDDSIFGLGMGCRGIIRVLLETARGNRSLEFLRECLERRRRGATAVLIDAPADFPLAVGARFSAPAQTAASGDAFENFIGDEWFKDLTKDLTRMSASGQIFNQSGAKVYQTSAGAVEFFLEAVAPPVSLLLFGAGFDALPVARFAKNLGWRLSVIDHRAAWASAERFPDADEIIAARAEDLNQELFEDENSVAVLMTHNYERDGEILRRLLNSTVKYIGALGPKSRTEKLLSEIGAENFCERQIAKIHAPVGLDIGAETPEEIALAVVAEIQSVLTNRAGGFLRERRGGIH